MYIIPTLIFVVRKMTFDIPTHSVGSRVMAAALLLWLLKTDVSRINGIWPCYPGEVTSPGLCDYFTYMYMYCRSKLLMAGNMTLPPC